MAAPTDTKLTMKKYFFLFCLSSSLLLTNGMEEVVVVHAPDSIKFLSSEPIHSSFLGDIFSAMLAYTVRSAVNWNSLATVTPWKRPEAVVVMEILGFGSQVEMPIDGTHFLFENAGDIDGQFDLLSYRTEERFFGKRPVLLHMDLGSELHDSKIVQPSLLKSLPALADQRLELALKDPQLGSLVKDSTFNKESPSDIQLLTEVVTVREFLKAIKSHKSDIRDNVPDIYWMKFGGLVPIVQKYGVDSLQFREAIRLLRQVISETETAMRNIYDDNVIISVMKVDESTSLYHQRKLLQATTEKPAPEVDPLFKYNLSYKWDPNFSATFAIVLFSMLTITLTVLAVSIAMWNMDPGRDSIIYRATTGRIKKD